MVGSVGEHEHGHEYERDREHKASHGQDFGRLHDRTRPWVFGMGVLGGVLAGVLLGVVILKAAYGDDAGFGGDDAAGVIIGSALFGAWAGVVGGGVVAALPASLHAYPEALAAVAATGASLAYWPIWSDRIGLATDAIGDGEIVGIFVFPVPELCVAAAVYTVLARARRRMRTEEI
jgi:hypothetical protein